MARPTNALIVDDETHIRVFMRLMLKEVGITAFWEAADGATAVSMAQEHQPELILLDFNLPRMNGLKVLAKLRELGLDVPVVMMTSESAITTVSEAMRLGAVGYVLKYLPRDQALEELRDVLDNLDAGEDEEKTA